ncbi:hypothetical protein IID19_05600 [Patescibacteria group bacterium]|nr:hypothetical protein [Patescibacteria group bacterium]
MFIRSNRVEYLWEFSKEIINDIFKVSLITYLAFLIIEDLKTGFISYFFDLKVLLVITIVSGILTILLGHEESHEEGNEKYKRSKYKYYIISVIFGLFSSALIYFRIKEIGSVALVLSIVSGFLVALVAIQFVDDDQPSNDQT